VPISVNRAEFSMTPGLDEMVVPLENTNRDNRQALLLPLDD